MGVQQNLLDNLAGDDLQFTLNLTYNSAPLDLSTISTVTAYLKATAIADDSTAKTYGIGTGLTVTSSPNGQLTWAVPHADTPGQGWYKVRVTDGQSKLVTALFGRFETDAV